MRKNSLRPARRQELAQWFRRGNSGVLCVSLLIGAVWASLLVSNKSRQGSLGHPAPYLGSDLCSTAVWLSSDLGVAVARGLVGESHTRSLSGWGVSAHASLALATQGLALWTSLYFNWSH